MKAMGSSARISAKVLALYVDDPPGHGDHLRYWSGPFHVCYRDTPDKFGHDGIDDLGMALLALDAVDLTDQPGLLLIARLVPLYQHQ